MAAFYNDYDDLIAYVPGGAGFMGGRIVSYELTENDGTVCTYGGELSAQWQPLKNWRLVASYSLLKENQNSGAGILVNDLPNNPQQQAQLRSYLNLTPKLELNGMLSWVDQINFQNLNEELDVPAYVRLDAGLVWHPTKSLELGIWGQNLLQARHTEFLSDTTTLQVQVPRSVMGKITWHF